MSAILLALLVIAISTANGVGFAEVASASSYKLFFNAERGGEKYILRILGGVVGFAIGLGAVVTGNLFACLYGPPLAVLWMTAVFLVLFGAGKLFFSLFR